MDALQGASQDGHAPLLAAQLTVDQNGLLRAKISIKKEFITWTSTDTCCSDWDRRHLSLNAKGRHTLTMTPPRAPTGDYQCWRHDENSEFQELHAVHIASPSRLRRLATGWSRVNPSQRGWAKTTPSIFRLSLAGGIGTWLTVAAPGRSEGCSSGFEARATMVPAPERTSEASMPPRYEASA